ncbi:alpha/beta hydrolase [Mucilaginibacter sp. BJC16-A38]|uniref:alpha/beta fold hydrolase n=1 Tax=Mucilaginibacter phenanthrenivorans TaxID=1234842 RepID=UPI002158784B|nr:alpha/beta hydrolase [Mucilaginibacter phenanthrenivorans]MCR8557330.1 alpha/beta hydrolase [Mucilaginibacter phenanthrenivorans]
MKKSEQLTKLSTGEHFAEVNNIVIHYHVAGAGPVLLLPSPGWGPSVDYIRPLTIFEQYFTMVYFDTRHSGQSTGPEDPEQYTLEHFVADIDALREYLDQPQIFVAGHSGGGHQVLEYGIRHSDHLSGIISIDAIAAADALRGAELMKRIAFKKDEPYYVNNPSVYEKASALMSIMGSDKAPKTLREIIDTMGCFYFHEPEKAKEIFSNLEFNDQVFGYVNAMGFQGKNLLPELHQIKAPVLIISGDDDFICDPMTQAVRIRAHIPSSKLVILDDCGHFPWIEQPRAFNEQCELWFNELGLQQQTKQ